MKNNVSIIKDAQPTFYKYLKLRHGGHNLCKEDLTEQVLRTLWAGEIVKDADIAQLFNTNIQHVRELRERYDITTAACIRRYMKQYAELLGSAGEAIMRARVAVSAM